MKSKYKFLIVSAIFLGLATFVPIGANAQDESSVISTDETAGAEASQVLSEDAELNDEPEALEGIEVEEAKNIPSGFGFWWKNMKEQASLVFTFNPVKKAEKQLKFAEERTKLANYMIENSADPKVQEKARQMLERANEHMQKIEERKDDLMEKTDGRSQKLLRNITKHYLNKERVLEKIEDKLPPEKLEEFLRLRKIAEEKGKNFLDNMQNNPNVSQEIKDRVENALLRVKNTQQAREELRTQQKTLLDEIKSGSQEAKKKFEELRRERKQNIEQVREQFREQKQEIINRIKAGEKEAVGKLKELNQEQQKEAAKKREEIKQKAMEFRQGIQQKRKEELQKIQENKTQLREQLKGQAEPTPSGN